MFNAVLRPQNVCLQTALCWIFFRVHCRKNQSSAFVFQIRESILTLRNEKQGMARLYTIYRLTNPCFLPKTLKASRCRNVLHDFLHLSNVAITPPEAIQIVRIHQKPSQAPANGTFSSKV